MGTHVIDIAEEPTKRKKILTLENILGSAAVTAMIAGFIMFLGATNRGWGSRGEREVYSFKYNGQTATVREDDRILAFSNQFYIQLPNKGVIRSGALVSDDNKQVYVGETTYSVTDKNQ